MKLSAVSNYFDRTQAYDAYTNRPAFKLQLDLYDDSKRDGVTVERRVISCKPTSVPPAAGCLRFSDANWILGRFHVDTFGGGAIRKKAIVQVADGLATIKSAAQALDNHAGRQAYAARAWEKSSKEIDESSEMYDIYSIFFHESVPIATGDVIQLSNQTHLVRDVYITEAGFRSAYVEVIEDYAVAGVTYRARTLNPVLETWGEVSESSKAIRLRWQTWFRYDSQASARFKEGDEVFLMPFALTPRPDHLVEAFGSTWRVISNDVVRGVNSVQVRRV